MFQKWIELEIILYLINKRSHLRELNKELNIPVTTLLRRINKLVDSNILSTNFEGKNKILLIKNSLEAREMVFISEHYKLLKLLKKYPQLKIIFYDILNESNSSLIVLFGSYAKFNATKESDIDIFILSSDKSEKKKIEFINTNINVKIGNEFNKDDLLIKEIIKDHVIIKGVEKFYEGN